MTMAYRKRLTVEAEQFWPGKKPWPEGVSADASPDVYLLDTGVVGGVHRVVSLRPGDWVVHNQEAYNVSFREANRAVDFPLRYELVEPGAG